MTILDEAAYLVDENRELEYGHPADDFGRVSRAARELCLDPTMGPREHSLYMILVKISRLIETPNHHDSVVDIAGYARCYEKILDAG